MSGDPRTGFQRRAPQEFVRRHRLLAGALHLRETYRSRTAGDGKPVIERRASRAGALAFCRTQRLDPYAIDLEPGAGKRRKSANVIVHLLPWLRPVDEI